jgi:hypothetical protein
MALPSRLLPFLIAASLGLPGAVAFGQSAATSPARGDAVAVPAPDETPVADPLLPGDSTIPPVPAPLPTTLAAAPPPLAAALPAGSGVLDSATVQRIVDRLVQLHFLASAADARLHKQRFNGAMVFQPNLKNQIIQPLWLRSFQLNLVARSPN